MRLTLRAAMALTAVLAASVFVAPAVSAQKGVGLLPPGTYQFSFAGADYSGFANNVQIFLNVFTINQVARPSGAPQSTTSETDLSLNLFDYSSQTFTFACLVLDHPSDFTIDNRLGTAALNTTLTPSTPACSFSQPLTDTLAISASWTGVGPLATSNNVSDYSCAGYAAESSGQGLTNTAKAHLTLTVDGATPTVFPATLTGLNSDTSRAAAHGTIDPLCGPAGIGSGPQPAGHYRFFGLFANGFWEMPPFGFNSVDLAGNSQSAQLGGGPANRSSETDLNLSFFGGSLNGFGCFAIPASDATINGLDSAAVQTTISDTTPICSNSFPGFGLSFPLAVNATWTGFGPVARVHNQSTYHCQGYQEATSIFVQNRGATASATVTTTDYFGNPQTTTLIDGFGSLTQISQSIQANGTLPLTCLIRF